MEIFISELMLQTLDIRCKCQVLLPGPGVMGGWVCGVRVWKSGRKKVPRYCDDVRWPHIMMMSIVLGVDSVSDDEVMFCWDYH